MTAVTGRLFHCARLSEEREGEGVGPCLSPGRALCHRYRLLYLLQPFCRVGLLISPIVQGPQLRPGELRCPTEPGSEPRSGCPKASSAGVQGGSGGAVLCPLLGYSGASPTWSDLEREESSWADQRGCVVCLGGGVLRGCCAHTCVCVCM